MSTVDDGRSNGLGLRPRASWLWLSVMMVALLVVIAVGAYLAGRSTVRQTMPEAVYDVEFDFLGALADWPPATGSDDPPFGGDALADERLLLAGRTVCVRARDRDMDFNRMQALLDLDGHQTYALITEALDKLCPSLEDYRGTLLGD